jgi:hypothetical protein
MHLYPSPELSGTSARKPSKMGSGRATTARQIRTKSPFVSGRCIRIPNPLPYVLIFILLVLALQKTLFFYARFAHG